ncbi:MAG: ribosome-associated translation inhibitor RaiA [Chloroflexi bacterium]|nr:ribosome-associated translation inhibitor RaiA [Chloroflexota bacterium]
MELIIKGKNVDISEAVRSYVNRKIGRLSRHIPNLTEGKIELTYEDAKAQEQRYRVQATLICDGTLLRGETKAGDFNTAIDAVADVLYRQIERYKGKLYRSGKKGAVEKAELEPEEEPEGKVVRIKRFPVKPMSEEEAMEQMELLGHDFFIYYDVATDSFSVLYRRKGGDYGIIHPELG